MSSRQLIFALAMALVLVSGAFTNSHAANLSGPYFSTPSCWSFACGLPAARVQSTTPSVMGAVGY